jgi:uncharacterized delta-60 repeat protein
MFASLSFSTHQRGVFRSLSLAAAVMLWSAASVCKATDGDLDPTFAGSGLKLVVFDLGNGNIDSPRTIVVDEENHLLVGGLASSVDYDSELVLARVMPDGSEAWKRHMPANPNYPGHGQALTARSMAGPCLAGTRFNTVSLQRDGYIVCTDIDGQDIGGQPYDHITVTPGESVGWHAATSAISMPFFYTAGTIGLSDSPGRDFFIARFNLAVTLDPTFNPQSPGLLRIDMSGQADEVAAMFSAVGGVYMVGSSHVQANNVGTDYDFALAAVGDDGTVESRTINFDVSESSYDDRASGVALDSQGRILIAGTATRDPAGADRDIAMVRMLSVLQPDPEFSQPGLPFGRRLYNFSTSHPEWDESVRGMVVDSYGRIYIVGTLFYPNQPANPSDVAVLRLKADGEIDTTFGISGRVILDFNTVISAGTSREEGVGIALQVDHPVILAEFGAGIDTDFAIARLTISEPAEIFSNGFE